MRWILVIGVLLASSTAAHADANLENWLIGPVFALRLGGPPGQGGSGIIGFEGGAGYGPERINLGFEHRSDHDFGYIELDPWYIVGGSFGMGMDDAGKASAVLGVWEGIPLPLQHVSCTDWNDIVTIAGGYRYTGVHELYLTIKAGRMHGSVCFD